MASAARAHCALRICNVQCALRNVRKRTRGAFGGVEHARTRTLLRSPRLCLGEPFSASEPLTVSGAGRRSPRNRDEPGGVNYDTSTDARRTQDRPDRWCAIEAVSDAAMECGRGSIAQVGAQCLPFAGASVTGQSNLSAQYPRAFSVSPATCCAALGQPQKPGKSPRGSTQRMRAGRPSWRVW